MLEVVLRLAIIWNVWLQTLMIHMVPHMVKKAHHVVSHGWHSTITALSGEAMYRVLASSETQLLHTT